MICSARGCRAHASHLLRWRNPRIHGGDREKRWAACDDHRGYLSDYLDVRGFLLDVGPMPADSGQPSAS